MEAMGAGGGEGIAERAGEREEPQESKDGAEPPSSRQKPERTMQNFRKGMSREEVEVEGVEPWGWALREGGQKNCSHLSYTKAEHGRYLPAVPDRQLHMPGPCVCQL